MLSHFSHVRLSVTPWTMACHAPLSMGFSRQEYWSGLSFPSTMIKYDVSEVSEVNSLSHVQLFATPWTAAHQVPPCMGFSRQEYWSGLQFPSLPVLIQCSSVTQSCLTLCNPMNCSMSGPPVHHQLPEFTQTNIHHVGDAIQLSHPLSSPSPPAPNPSHHQSLFQ